MDWTHIEERVPGDLADVVILDVRGKITLSDAPGRLFHRIIHLLEQERSRILIDMTEVPFLDSQGLADVVQGFKIASARHGTVKLYGVCDRIRELLNLTRLIAVIETFDSEEQALDAFRRISTTGVERAFLPDHPPIPGYEPERLIARNGAALYLARRVSSGERVVLKVYNAAGVHVRARDAMLARLDHPNILRVAEMGEVDGCAYAAVEYVGGTLADRLRSGPLPAADTARICLAIAAALEYARGQRVAHLNLMPSSIGLDDDELPKLFDFEAIDRGRNAHGSIARRGFSTPEELTGGDGATVAGDVYRIGAAMYAMLTGRPPFAGEWKEVVTAVLQRPPSNPHELNSTVPSSLQRVCLKCLEKHAGDRYGSLHELAEDLERAREPVSAV